MGLGAINEGAIDRQISSQEFKIPSYTVIRCVLNSARFGTCTVVSLNGATC